MTQEQRINRGTIIIFVLSMILLACLCVTTTLAYFAGKQTNNTTLILGGPVRVSIIDNENNNTYGQGNLVMNIKGGREHLLPGIGIDMHAIANVTSSKNNPTNALLRAILDIDIIGNLNDYERANVEGMIRHQVSKSLTLRIDSKQQGARDGWVYHSDGCYYYCSQTALINEVGQEVIVLAPIITNELGLGVPFINGTLQFPTKPYTNEYADIELTFTLKFQAIQESLVDEDHNRIPNTIENVGKILDELDWSTHND